MRRRKPGRISKGKLGLGLMTGGLSLFFTGVRKKQEASSRRTVRARQSVTYRPAPAPRRPEIVRKDLAQQSLMAILKSDGMKWYVPKLPLWLWVASCLYTVVVLLCSLQVLYSLIGIPIGYVIALAISKENVLCARPYLKIGITSRYEGNWETENDDTDELILPAIQKVDAMDGHAFEYFVAELLEKNGYQNVSVTRGSGDQGVDVLAELNGIKYAIQCKNYSRPLGNTPVQEVNAGKHFYGCHVGVVVTNNYFTAGGKELASSVNVILWDRDKLCEMIDISERALG